MTSFDEDVDLYAQVGESGKVVFTWGGYVDENMPIVTRQEVLQRLKQVAACYA